MSYGLYCLIRDVMKHQNRWWKNIKRVFIDPHKEEHEQW